MNDGTAPKPTTVLIVDDQPDVLIRLHDLVKARFPDARVMVASTGGAALESSVTPDVVVCDYGLPGMDGVETLAQVRKQWPHARRVLMTDNPDVDIAVDAINEAEVARFLLKPIAPDLFLDALDVTHAAKRPESRFGRIPRQPKY
jgi:DNA-binding NarL/FixJ family response regulator